MRDNGEGCCSFNAFDIFKKYREVCQSRTYWLKRAQMVAQNFARPAHSVRNTQNTNCFNTKVLNATGVSNF